MSLPGHIALCFCVRDCAPYLPCVFANIDDLRQSIPGVRLTCVFVYDNCTDSSEALLMNYRSQRPDVIVETIPNPSPLRTVRIANARNVCLDNLDRLGSVEYHAMIDCDDKGAGQWDIEVIRNALSSPDDWDCLTFDRKVYYDTWALLFGGFTQHSWGFQRARSPGFMLMYRVDARVNALMQAEIRRELNESHTPTIEVVSAFNGFAIYKTRRFRGLRYDGHASAFNRLYSEPSRRLLEKGLLHKYGLDTRCVPDGVGGNGEACEHLFYNVLAHRRGCKIKISKSIVCDDPPRSVPPTVDRGESTSRSPPLPESAVPSHPTISWKMKGWGSRNAGEGLQFISHINAHAS